MQRFNRMIAIGGEDAKLNAYPWMVQLKEPKKYGNEPICGGAVINSRSELFNL